MPDDAFACPFCTCTPAMNPPAPTRTAASPTVTGVTPGRRIRRDAGGSSSGRRLVVPLVLVQLGFVVGGHQEKPPVVDVIRSEARRSAAGTPRGRGIAAEEQPVSTETKNASKTDESTITGCDADDLEV